MPLASVRQRFVALSAVLSKPRIAPFWHIAATGCHNGASASTLEHGLPLATTDAALAKAAEAAGVATYRG
jgi:hypothetical protein